MNILCTGNRDKDEFYKIFDLIFKNRKALYDNIPNIIQNSKTIYENKLQNQSSLFSDESQKISYLIQDKKTSHWSNDEILSKEFESVGFYISNHPLKDYEIALKQYKVKSFQDFENGNDKEAFVAGTIMSIKEKKTAKGNSFAIISPLYISISIKSFSLIIFILLIILLLIFIIE